MLGVRANDDVGYSHQTVATGEGVERQASAGARDGVKGKGRTLAARAPLHAIVRLRLGGTAERTDEAIAGSLCTLVTPIEEQVVTMMGHSFDDATEYAVEEL